MKKSITYILLALIILFHLANNLYILSHHKTPPSGDSAIYLRKSLYMHNLLKKGNVESAIYVKTHYGHFFLHLTQPFYFLFGKGVFSALLINNIFFVILLLSIFLLGKELFSDDAGWLAAFLISFYPQVYGMSRVYMLDFALTAMICLDLYLLIKTKDFTLKNFSVLLGVCLGISALIKPPFIIFLIGPIMVVFFNGFHFNLKDIETRIKIKNFLITLFISLSLYSTWFFREYHFILKYILKGINVNYSDRVYPFWDWNNFLNWAKVILNYQVLFFFGILFVIAFIYFLLSKQFPRKTKLFLSTSFVIPYFFFTCVILFNKDPRFILPLTISISLISSAFLTNIRSNALKKVVIGGCIVVGFLQFFILCYGDLGTAPQNRSQFEREYFGSFIKEFPNLMGMWQFGVFQYSTNSLVYEEIVFDTIIKDIPNNSRQYIVLVSDCWFYDPFGFRLQLEDIQNIEVDYCNWPGYNDKPDYFLLLNEPINEVGPLLDECLNQKHFEKDKDSYSLLATVLIDSSKINLPAVGNTSLTSIRIYKRLQKPEENLH